MGGAMLDEWVCAGGIACVPPGQLGGEDGVGARLMLGASSADESVHVADDDPDAAECADMIGSMGDGVGYTLLLLVQRIFGGAEDILKCIDLSSRPIAGGLLSGYYSLMTIILLGHLLILFLIPLLRRRRTGQL